MIGQCLVKVAEAKEPEKSQEKELDADFWKPDTPTKSEKFESKVGILLGVIKNFGIVISVITLAIIGLRAMFGSVQERSDYKESLPTHLIGVIILLACTVLPDIIYKIAINF